MPLVQFTGMELDTRQMPFCRFVKGPFPLEWERVVFPVDEFDIRRLKSWLLENVNGRMGILKSYDRVAIYFEDSHDAVLFRLKDGGDAWRDDSPSF